MSLGRKQQKQWDRNGKLIGTFKKKYLYLLQQTFRKFFNECYNIFQTLAHCTKAAAATDANQGT